MSSKKSIPWSDSCLALVWQMSSLGLTVQPQLDIICQTLARQLSDRGMKSSSCDMKSSASILPLPGLLDFLPRNVYSPIRESCSITLQTQVFLKKVCDFIQNTLKPLKFSMWALLNYPKNDGLVNSSLKTDGFGRTYAHSTLVLQCQNK